MNDETYYLDKNEIPDEIVNKLLYKGYVIKNIKITFNKQVDIDEMKQVFISTSFTEIYVFNELTEYYNNVVEYVCVPFNYSNNFSKKEYFYNAYFEYIYNERENDSDFYKNNIISSIDVVIFKNDVFYEEIDTYNNKIYSNDIKSFKIY